jgi:hypothetical protein
MKNLLIFLPLVLILSCKENAKQNETVAPAASTEGWTKPMMTAVDAPTTYYDDLEDQDFSDYSKLIYEVIEQVYAGKLQAYNYIDASPMSIDDVKKAGQQVDTIFVDNPNPPFEQQMKIVVSDLSENIVSLKVKETWHFNKETIQLEKKVLGICPRFAVHNMQTGELRGYTPWFWVFFDKEAEQTFIKLRSAQ